MGRNKQLAKNISYVAIGNLGSKLIGFILLPLYTSWLSPSDYGTVDIITVYASLLLNLVAFDLADAIFIFPSGKDENEVRQYFSTGFCFQIICAIFLGGLFYCLKFVHSDESFFKYIWLIYVILVSQLFQVYCQNFCRGINKMSVFSYTGIINSLSIAVLSILFIPKYGVVGYVGAITLANIITGAFTFVYSHSYNYLGIRYFEVGKLKEMLLYSIPLMPTAVMWWLIFGLNRPLLERYCGLYAIGVLAVAGKLPSIMAMVFSMFQQAWTVTVLQEYEKNNFCEYNNSMYRIMLSLQVLVCMCITVFARPFILIMTTSEYMEAWKYIPLITIGTLFSNISGFTGVIFTAYHKSIYVFISTIIGGVTSVLFYFILIPKFGVYGACISIILAHLCNAISRAFYSNKFVKFEGVKFTIWQLSVVILCYISCFIDELSLRIIAQIGCFFIFGFSNMKDIRRLSLMFVERIKSR
jgi:O-antigen/teichoic acid export membrane protein